MGAGCEAAFFEHRMEAWMTGCAVVEPRRLARRRLETPAQLRSACLSRGAVAQQEDRCACCVRTQAEPAADGKVERLGRTGDVGNHRCYGTAGNSFLKRPQQFWHCLGAAQNNGIRIEPEVRETGCIRQPDLLGLAHQSDQNDGRPTAAQQGAHLPQCKAKQRPGITLGIGKDFMQQSRRAAQQVFRPGCGN